MVYTFTSTSPVAVGSAVKKSFFDKLFANCNFLRETGTTQAPVVSLTGRNASISPTTYMTTTAAGWYRVNWYFKLTTAATTSSSLVFYVTHTHGTSQAQTPYVSGYANTTGVSWGGSFLIYCDAATAIQYGTTYTSTGATAMVYSLGVAVERVY